MDESGRSVEELLPLSAAVYDILLTLAGGQRHGYGIMQDIAKRTGRRPGSATLYRTIRNLLIAGLIVECDVRSAPTVDDQRRRLYQLTPFGRQVAIAESRRLCQLIEIARRQSLLGERGLA